jgi:hypothetical protein
MPKKKLTKLQVKRLMASASKNIATLMLDRALHGSSFVPITINGLIDLDKKLKLASKRIK